jgi:DNA mismatch repair ATPase MutL
VKDKVLSHALREAYGPLLPEGRFPAFVLFFDLPSQEVDVNVHPTKHEVRFHEVRQVHDFIVQAIEQCMQQGLKLLAEDTAVRQQEHQPGHELHSALGQTDTTSQYDSYNQFIASAYRSNLAEDRPRSDYSSTSTALLTQHANDWCLVQHNDQIGLLELDKLFNLLATTESKAVELRYPEIIQIPDSEQATFEQFCERRGVQLNISHDMIKIIAVPGSWQHTDIKALVWSWYCFEQDQELPSMQWLVPWIENPPTGFKLPINFLAMAKLKRLFDGSA